MPKNVFRTPRTHSEQIGGVNPKGLSGGIKYNGAAGLPADHPQAKRQAPRKGK